MASTRGLCLYVAWVSHPPTPSQCGATADRRTRDRKVSGSKFACAIWFFTQARKLIGIARLPSSLVVLIRPSPHHRSHIGRAPIHSSVKTSTRCLHYGGGNCSPGSSRLYRLGISQAQKAIVSGDASAGSKSQCAATRFIAYAPNFTFRCHPANY